jgi:hypothetical protein
VRRGWPAPCGAHGLREARPEPGGRERHAPAYGGLHRETPAQAKVYTDAVDRKRFASKGLGKVATVKDEPRSPKTAQVCHQECAIGHTRHARPNGIPLSYTAKSSHPCPARLSHEGDRHVLYHFAKKSLTGVFFYASRYKKQAGATKKLKKGELR